MASPARYQGFRSADRFLQRFWRRSPPPPGFHWLSWVRGTRRRGPTLIARNHWKCSLGAWLALGGVAEVVGLLPPGATIALSPVAAGGGLGPDLDKPPERHEGKVKPGATAAEAHGLASNALAELISRTHGGHRGLTHRYPYALAVGALVLVLGWRWPLWTALVLIAWWSAWPLYCQLPRDRRWASALLGAVLAAVMAWRAWVPETHGLAAAAALGWAMHIACDHFQSLFTKLARWIERRFHFRSLAQWVRDTFGLGSPGEAAVGWLSLVLGVAAWSMLTNPYPFS